MKFLTDSQTSQLFVNLLLKLDWDVETVYQHKIHDDPEDFRVFAYARSLGRTFITFDDLRGESGIKVLRELRDRGGRLLQVRGGPSQPERALGRVYFHYPEWHPWLNDHEGRVIISDTRHSCRMMPRSRVRAVLRKIDADPFETYLESRDASRKRPLRRIRRKKVPLEQGVLMTYAKPKRTK